MIITYKSVSVYVDKDDNVIAIPQGNSKKYCLAGLDIIFELNKPYSDNQLEKLLRSAMNKCYSEESNDSSEISPLEKHLKVKGFAKAVQNRRLVGFDWYDDAGYVVIPTHKKPRQGFVHMEDKTIKLGKELKEGELSKAFKEAAKLSITY